MKKIALLTAACALVASAAFAAPGADLSSGACPDNTGASSSHIVDCAGGEFMTVLVTWSPNENIASLVGMDCLLETAVGGDLNNVAGFWNFDPAGCNPAAISNAFGRPSTGCSSPAYTATWGNAGIAGIATANRSATTEESAFNCARATNLSVTAGQRLFGSAIGVDASTSLEAGAGGTCTGCTLPVCLYLKQITPASSDANEHPTPLNTPTGNGAAQGISNLLTLNGGTGLCATVPTHKNTWGQLKSLYR